MSFLISSGLQYHQLTTGDLKTALDGMVIKIYGSPTNLATAISQIPVTADAAVVTGDTILLSTISVGGAGTGVTFENVPVTGAIYKTTSETWVGTNSGSGYPAFYRLELAADTGLLSTTAIRCQGSVGQINADLIIAASYMTSGVDQRIDSYLIGQPTT